MCRSLIVALASVLTLTPAMAAVAQVQTGEPRPQLRPVAPEVIQLAAVSLPRPQLRPVESAKIAPEETATLAASNAGFQNWVNGFYRRARAQGISQQTLDRAFRNVSYDAEVIRRDSNQSEFTKTIWQYLDSAASDTRVKNGGKALRQNSKTLDAIQAHYGVDKEVVVAVWGLESSYGTYRGDMDVIRSLATLAYDGRRGKFFESQLIAALKILQSGDVAPRKMTGSWAGAMGHTQFIPTSYEAFAVDFTGDGKRDIWSDDPTDALASTAAYLKRSGWVAGQPWGVEVRLPSGFDFALASRKIKKSPSEWGRLGVKDTSGRAVKNYGQASILLPAGGNGAAFMIFKNFSVIERYNAADAYVIGVGHLSDRLKGGDEIKGRWPRGDRALNARERREMQRRLTRAGFNTQGVDGKVGPNTITAIRQYQKAKGLAPDGYASLSLLKHLR